MDIPTLEKTTLANLRKQAKDLGVERAAKLKKEELLITISQAEASKQGREVRGGVLEIMNEGVGFLRSDHYQGGPGDVYHR
jgi:transcription termination factor Rho